MLLFKSALHRRAHSPTIIFCRAAIIVSFAYFGRYFIADMSMLALEAMLPSHSPLKRFRRAHAFVYTARRLRRFVVPATYVFMRADF